MVKYIHTLILLLAGLTAFNQVETTETCEPNPDCYDSNYPDIQKWASAGVTGGIPIVTNIKATVSPGGNIQSAIDNGGAGVVVLKNGTYTIISQIKMKSNVVLRGESRDGVKLSIKMKNADAILMSSTTSYSGLENMTVVYEYLPSPPKTYRDYEGGFNDGGYCKECFQNDYPDCDGSLLRIEGNNNWVDNVELHDSGSDPVYLSGDHNTVRNSLVDNCYNKGGGGEGYFDLRGDYNLVTGSTVRLIRHFSIQQKAKYNVVYKNNLEVDVNFHNKDEGHNLVEQNSIIRPSWHSWGVFATGGAAYGHTPPGPDNVFVNNTCYDYREKRNEWDEKDVIYTYTGYGDPTKTDWKMPKCGTFYAVSCNDVVVTPVPSINISEPADKTTIVPGSDLQITGTASISEGAITKVELYVDGSLKENTTNGNFSFTIPSLAEGEYDLYIIAYADNGETKQSETISMKASNAETVEINPIHDAYLQGSTLYNTGDLRVEAVNRVSYLQFDLSSIEGKIESINLNLSVGADAGSGDVTISQALHSNWTEENLSETNAPNSETVLAHSSGALAIGTTYSYDVSNAAIADGKLTLIVTMASGGNDVSFASKEYANAALHPVLKVDVNKKETDPEPIQVIKLTAGWNLIGCPIEGQTAIQTALSSIWDKVEVVKDFDGFYHSTSDPAFNSLIELQWGKGYFVKVNEDCELVWE